MAIEALKRIFQITLIKKEREGGLSPRDKKRQSPRKPAGKDEERKIDIKV